MNEAENRMEVRQVKYLPLANSNENGVGGKKCLALYQINYQSGKIGEPDNIRCYLVKGEKM